MSLWQFIQQASWQAALTGLAGLFIVFALGYELGFREGMNWARKLTRLSRGEEDVTL